MNIEILWTPKGGRLVVTLPDYGTLIRCEQETDTFVEAIKRIGVERVKALGIEIVGIPLISTTDDTLSLDSKRDAAFSTNCCFHFENWAWLRLWCQHSSACELSPRSASRTTEVLNSGVKFLRFRFAIGCSFQ